MKLRKFSHSDDELMKISRFAGELMKISQLMEFSRLDRGINRNFPFSRN